MLNIYEKELLNEYRATANKYFWALSQEQEAIKNNNCRVVEFYQNLKVKAEGGLTALETLIKRLNLDFAEFAEVYEQAQNITFADRKKQW